MGYTAINPWGESLERTHSPAVCIGSEVPPAKSSIQPSRFPSLPPRLTDTLLHTKSVSHTLTEPPLSPTVRLRASARTKSWDTGPPCPLRHFHTRPMCPTCQLRVVNNTPINTPSMLFIVTHSMTFSDSVKKHSRFEKPKNVQFFVFFFESNNFPLQAALHHYFPIKAHLVVFFIPYHSYILRHTQYTASLQLAAPMHHRNAERVQLVHGVWALREIHIFQHAVILLALTELYF